MVWHNNFAYKYLGQQTNPGTWGYAGIKVSNCPYLLVGNSLNTPNGNLFFHELANGIIFNNSNLEINNSTFKHMKFDSQYYLNGGTLNNCGVNGNKGTIRFTGLGGTSTSPTTFEDCGTGIELLQSRGDISLLRTISNVRTGISLRSCRGLNIFGNYIQTSVNGINVLKTVINNGANIHNNIIVLSSWSGSVPQACINVNEFSQNTPHNIFENYIYINSGRWGVVFNSVKGATIQDNLIQLSSNLGQSCIGLNSSPANHILCNTATSTIRPVNGTQSGIRLMVSTDNEIVDNTVNNENFGIRFSGTCDNTILKTNTINFHDIGLRLDNLATISQQLNYGNNWQPQPSAYSLWGAFTSNTGIYLTLSRFEYEQGLTNNFPPTISPPGWFGFNGNADAIPTYACVPLALPLDYFSEDDELNAQFYDSSPSGEIESYWSDRFLFKKLEDNPSLLINNPILQAFYDQNLYGNIGNYTNVAIEIENALHWDGIYQFTYLTNENIRINKLDSLHLIDSLLQVDNANEALYFSLKENLIAEIELIEISNENIMEIINQIREVKLSNAELVNSNLIDESLYEENESVVNEIYLATIARDSYKLSNNQISTLEQIADQCPFIGGPAVIKAREIYKLYESNTVWDDDAICAASGYSPRLKAKSNDTIISIYPNPAGNIISLNYKLPEFEEGLLKIFNTLGTIMISRKLESDQKLMLIDVSSLPSNIYLCKIFIDGAEVYDTKLSIVK